MKRTKILCAPAAAVLIALLVSACASQPIYQINPQPIGSNEGQGPTSQSPTVAPANGKLAPGPQKVEVPIVTFNQPKDAAPAASPADANPAAAAKDLTTTRQLVEKENFRFEIKPAQEDYDGGAVEYNYVDNQVYQIFTTALNTTDILLQPGEEIVSAPIAGDTKNWILITGFYIDHGQKRTQLLLKDRYPDKETTLTVSTSKRVYNFKVYSYRTTFMPLVSFDYPMDDAQKMQEQAKQAQQQITLYGRVTDLQFGYKIIPHSFHAPHWMPSLVFNDGRTTYIYFPSANRASYAPVLFEVSANGKRTIINYTVIGTYYVCTGHIIEHAELVLDINDGNIVTILKEEK